MSYAIRSATRGDLEAIRAIAWNAYARYVSRIGRPPAPMVADFGAALARSEVDVAISKGDEIHGFIIHFRRDEDWFVENVAVDPDAQGAGLGKVLMVHAETAATAASLSRIELYTNEKMVENIPFYEALGYRRFDFREEDGFRRIYFEKHL